MTAVVLMAVPAGADENHATDIRPYFGLAAPYPVDVPEIDLDRETSGKLRNRSLLITLDIDKDGTVIDVAHPPDSAAYVDPIESSLRSIRFAYLDGIAIGEPITVPVHLTYSGNASKGKSISLRFPVSPDLTSDTLMLKLFFSYNDIVPPRLVSLPEIFYRVSPGQDAPDYLTITARVELDAAGNLVDVGFPLPGYDNMTHSLQTALIHAEFEPAAVKGEKIAADFFVTIRVFGNMAFPREAFAPIDSTGESNLTEQYFLTCYYNTADIRMFPLPRNYGRGYLRSKQLSDTHPGDAIVRIRIDSLGIVRGTSVLRAAPGSEENARQVARLIQWYPAIDESGRRVDFAGDVRIRFNGSTKIVFIPEWLVP